MTDLVGNPYEGITSWDFSVNPLADGTAPILDSMTPANGTSADKATDIIMAFSETISGDAQLQLKDRDSDTIISGTPTMTANQIGFVPDSDLVPGANYTVTVQNNVTDLAGNPYAGILNWDFSVNPLVDAMLTVTHIKRNSNKITIEFYDKLDPSTVSESNFLINGGAINYSGFKVTPNKWQVEFTADTPLSGDENITISGTIADQLGNVHNGGIARDYSVSGILSVWDVKYSGDVVTVKFWEIPGPLEKLNPLTINESDFLINGGAISFSGLNVKDYEVKFTADTPLNGDEIISILGDIKDLDGNIHNYGVAVTHGFR